MSSYDYPLLKKITESYSVNKKHQLKNVYICACQHLLEPQEKMFDSIAEFGIPKENIFIFGKIYSTNNDVLQELKDKGFVATQPAFNPKISFDKEHEENCREVFHNCFSKIKNLSKIIVLDDGGELLKIVNDEYQNIKNKGVIIGIEQTSSGFRKLEKEIIHFPIINVARSSIKLIKESPLIADLGCRRIIDVFNLYSIQKPRILVVGLGPMGSHTLRILKEKKYFAVGHDILHGSTIKIVDLVKDNEINVIVGATGSNILNESQITSIKNQTKEQVYFISMSSADREFPTVYIRSKGIVPEKIHGDVVWENLILINNGFPITFKGLRYESTPKEIERTIALLYGSTIDSLLDEIKGVGFIDVPQKVISIIEQDE